MTVIMLAGACALGAGSAAAGGVGAGAPRATWLERGTSGALVPSARMLVGERERGAGSAAAGEGTAEAQRASQLGRGPASGPGSKDRSSGPCRSSIASGTCMHQRKRIWDAKQYEHEDAGVISLFRRVLHALRTLPMHEERSSSSCSALRMMLCAANEYHLCTH